MARQKLNHESWDYIVGGAETETTVRRNRLALDSIAFRPRVLRDVSQDRRLGQISRAHAAPAGRCSRRSAGLELFTPEGGARRRPRGATVRHCAHAEFGLPTGTGGSGAGGARGAAHVSALRARRRGLDRRDGRARRRRRLRRVLPHRRHRLLQPARARYREAPQPPRPDAGARIPGTRSTWDDVVADQGEVSRSR